MGILAISPTVWLTLTYIIYAYGQQCVEIDPIIKPCICSIVKNDRSEDEVLVTCDQVNEKSLITALRKMVPFRVNKLTISNSNIAENLPNLFNGISISELDVRNTLLTNYIDSRLSFLKGLESTLKFLVLRSCGITKWGQIGDLQNLISLDLSGNALESVDEEWFRTPPVQLQLLYFRQNQISHLDRYVFSNLHNLVLLDLSENKISKLERTMFPKPTRKLMFLYLSYNRIASLPTNIFTDFQSLQRVYLDFNGIQVLRADVWLPPWPLLKTLDLLGNDISCDCSLFWMTEIILPSYFDGQCSSPPSLSGRKLNSLWPWDVSEAPELIGEDCSSINLNLLRYSPEIQIRSDLKEKAIQRNNEALGKQ